MKCMICGHEMLPPEKGNRQYLCGLNVTLHGVPVSKCSNCEEEEVEIPEIAKLNRLLARFISSQTERLTAKEFRFLRKELGYSKEDFAKKINIPCSEIAAWENDNGSIPLQFELLLRLQSLLGEPIERYSDLPETILTVMSASHSTHRPLYTEVEWSNNDWRAGVQPA